MSSLSFPSLPSIRNNVCLNTTDKPHFLHLETKNPKTCKQGYLPNKLVDFFGSCCGVLCIKLAHLLGVKWGGRSSLHQRSHKIPRDAESASNSQARLPFGRNNAGNYIHLCYFVSYHLVCKPGPKKWNMGQLRINESEGGHNKGN